jgi:primary-amine oxidase
MTHASVAAVILSVLLNVAALDAPAASHPLEPLTPAEFKASYQAVRAHFASRGLPTDRLLFPAIFLDEPPKASVLAWSVGQDFSREARVQVMHYPTNRLWVAIVDLERQRVTSLQLQPRGTQPSVTADEFIVADELVRAHAPWQAAMRRRGVNPDNVYIDTWAPGDLDLPADVAATLPDGQQTRILRNISFHRGAPLEAFDPEAPQNLYAKPIEGVIVTVDMNRRRVIHMVDSVFARVISESGNARVRRAPLKPLRVQQPQGTGIELAGRRVKWQNWSFYAVLSPREGLVLYDVRYDDRGRSRPVAYRLSLSEVYVPYGVPDNNWVFRTAFDVGEYFLATYAQTLEPNRDVPENALFLDAVFPMDTGPTAENPTGTVDFPATVALYERDGGLLWTRTDPTNFIRETRFARELVVTWNAWIGNYIYGFDWIFRMDGSIEVRVNANGTLQPRGVAGGDEPTSPTVAVDGNGVRVSGPNHQHFVNFRLDLDVDGTDNEVLQANVGRLQVPGFKNAFAARETRIDREGFDDVNPASARTWHVRSSSRRNALGEGTSYELVPGETAMPYSADDFEPLLRAQFAKHPFWVSRYRDGELYAAGDFPNQGNAGDGLPAFVGGRQALGTNTDLVIWYTAGFTHIPRPEDYPVMPQESIGFKLMPHGFFARNPALDAPDQAAKP